ncbi:hypothetical protein NFI96_000446 [Prochilodus magdalenae]|nr:hypothetical protein NFI96_000446 [Prochilodus magdalenae]
MARIKKAITVMSNRKSQPNACEFREIGKKANMSRMEEMFLRVFVVLASLVCLKDHTFFDEQDDIMDMQEREHLLQKEGPKPQQEVNPVAIVPTLVSQSHHRLTRGEGEEGDVQQILPNGQTDKKQQLPNRDLPAKNLSPKEGMQPEILHSNQNVTEEVLPKGNETVIQKDPHTVNDTEATSETQTSTAVHDQGQEASHLDQAGTFEKQVSSEQAKEISQEKPKSFFQQTVFGFIRTWFQAPQGVHTSLEKESLEGSKHIPMQVIPKTEEIDKSTSKADKGDPQTTNRISHADQKPSTPRQMQTKALEGEQNTYTWYFWKTNATSQTPTGQFPSLAMRMPSFNTLPKAFHMMPATFTVFRYSHSCSNSKTD